MTLVQAWHFACSGGLIAMVLVGCGGGEEVPPHAGRGGPSGHESAQETLAQVEHAFLGAEGRRVVFEVRAEGVFTASLDGHLVLDAGNALSLEASGVFGADSVSLWLDASRDPMAWGNAGDRFEQRRPDGLRDAVVIGLVRMGVLHNLARLVSGAPPDRMDADVGSWVQAVAPEWVGRDPRVGDTGISFEIQVEGQRAGTATVWLDSGGAVVGRDQLVQFPTGEMRVTERYRWEDASLQER